MDSEELTAPVDSDKVNKNRVGADLAIVTKMPSKGDAGIRKSSQLGVNENGVGADLEIITETPSKGDARIRKS